MTSLRPQTWLPRHKDLESAGETPEYTRLALNLREALAESEEAISRLNVELGIDADGEETTAQVR